MPVVTSCITSSTSASPNENYARELYELFTLGVDNGYTQQDIVETSKALTGYNHRENTIQPDYLAAFRWFASTLGQRMFEPVDVAGWQGDRDWINASTLTGRWRILQWVIWHTWNNYPEEFRTFAIARSNNSNDPYVVTKSIIDSFMPVELFTISDYQDATDIFKHNLPENYYEEGFWNLQYDSAPYQVLLLIRHLIKLPEFQLK